jgi:predicted transcriptional regulator
VLLKDIKHMSNIENITIHLDTGVLGQLFIIAKQRDVTVSALVQEVIGDYIEQDDWQARLIQQRLDMANNGGVIWPIEEVTARLSKLSS